MSNPSMREITLSQRILQLIQAWKPKIKTAVGTIGCPYIVIRYLCVIVWSSWDSTGGMGYQRTGHGLPAAAMSPGKLFTFKNFTKIGFRQAKRKGRKQRKGRKLRILSNIRKEKFAILAKMNKVRNVTCCQKFKKFTKNVKARNLRKMFLRKNMFLRKVRQENSEFRIKYESKFVLFLIS